MKEKEKNNDYDLKLLGARIRHWREKRGMTQVELCSKIGITQGALAHIEKSNRTPQVDTLVKIGKVLDIHPAIFFAGEHIAVFDLLKLPKRYKSSEDIPDFLRANMLAVVGIARKYGLEG